MRSRPIRTAMSPSLASPARSCISSIGRLEECWGPRTINRQGASTRVNGQQEAREGTTRSARPRRRALHLCLQLAPFAGDGASRRRRLPRLKLSPDRRQVGAFVLNSPVMFWRSFCWWSSVSSPVSLREQPSRANMSTRSRNGTRQSSRL